MYSLNVKIPHKNYSIYIENGLLDNIGERLHREINPKKLNKRVALITDSNVDRLYGNKIRDSFYKSDFHTNVISIRPGEQSKTLEVVNRIYNELLDFNITRGDLIIAFGGGVVGDIAGFVASTFLRGIPFIQVPTSLLAQVDSSVGGKVAVNLSRGKNLVGSFYHPETVLIDTNVLETLEDRFFYDGMAEVIKYGCIMDKNLFQRLETSESIDKTSKALEEIVYKCCKIKGEIVEKDEKDTADRMILNFGHTLGHAIESFYNYERYTHGEAVAIGMYNITKKSEDMGLTDKGTSKAIKNVLKRYNLPFQMPKLLKEEITNIIKLDKKNKGNYINIVLLHRIGEGYIKKIKMDELYRFI